MKDIIISVDSTSHKVNFPDEFLGIGYENLQGNLIFQFDNNFIGGQARLDISIDCESGMIPNLTPYENGYILPIKSSLLTGSNVLMQLVIDETTRYVFRVRANVPINAIVKPMIEKGNKINSYTPFGTTPIEYCVIGNYADIFFKNVISSPLYNATLELDKWYLKKYIGKLVLDGTENWATNSIYNCYQLNMGYAINQHSVNSLSNLFVEKGAGLLGTQYGMYTKYTYNLLVGFPNSTLSDFKTFLGQNNMILYYVLNDNRIIYTLLNETLQSQLEYIYNQMLAYKGQTNISQINNDLPFIIDSTALKDLTSL